MHALATDAIYSRYGETVLALHTYPLPSLPPGLALPSAHRGRLCPKLRTHGAPASPVSTAHSRDGCRTREVPTLLNSMAVCVAHVVNAGPWTWTTPEGSQCIAAQVATAAGSDMRTCLTTTKDSYVGRVPKALIGGGRAGRCRDAGGKADRWQQEGDHGGGC